MRFTALALAAILVCAVPNIFARASSSPPQSSEQAASATRNAAVPGVARDSRGKIARSPHALYQFKKFNPCPGTGKTYGACPGYVVDHVIPLKRGGADDLSNMQWQTKAEAKEKDRWE